MHCLLRCLAAVGNLLIEQDAVYASPQCGLGTGVHGTLSVKPYFVLQICVLAVLHTLEEKPFHVSLG